MAEDLVEVTLESWDTFLHNLDPNDICSYIGPTSASIVTYWPSFSIRARELAKRCLEYIVFHYGDMLSKTKKLGELVNLSTIDDLKTLHQRVAELKGIPSGSNRLRQLLGRITNDNLLVIARALQELKSFLVNEEALIRKLASGDVFDPLICATLSALLNTTTRDGEGTEIIRSLAFECIGALGALDPDRLEFSESDTKMVVVKNFTDEPESITFAVHLIKDVLVGAFRSTSDTQYQTQIAYTIQELLKFCNFTSSLIGQGSATSASLRARHRWSLLPKQVIETITPFLASQYTLNSKAPTPVQYPIYPNHSTYREWISAWTSDLITLVSIPDARRIFSVFASVVRNRDVGVAHHLLPHLVLSVLISDHQGAADNIRLELLSVLEDQVDASTKSTIDKRELSAQVRTKILTWNNAHTLCKDRIFTNGPSQ
jgi:serine/threonine-protein kinase ATR